MLRHNPPKTTWPRAPMIVVIGVLLAIEVSNWNEVRLEKRAERVLIERLLQDTEELFVFQKA